MSDISDKILNLLTEKNISYRDLEKSTNIPRSALQRYATGETEKIPLNRLNLIASALNVSPAYLMGWEEKVGDSHTSYEENLISDFSSLSDEDKIKAIEYIKLLKKAAESAAQ